MSDPTLTVVMATYAHGGVIERALRAICEQSRPPDEFVLFDDGSTDDTQRVVAPYVERYPFLRYERSEKNLGSGPALKHVFAQATSDYVYGAAADDFVLPGAFEKIMGLAGSHPEAGVVFGEVLSVDPVGRAFATTRIERWGDPGYRDRASVLSDWLRVEPATLSLSAGTYYRRDALEGMGSFPWSELSSWADTFTSRTLALRHGAAYLPEPVVAWTVLETSLSQAARNDPRRQLDIGARAARLMRDERFAELYPDEFVRRWEADYRERTISGYCESIQQALRRVSESRHELSAGIGDRTLRALVRGGTGALNLVLTRALRASLERYRPGN